MQVLTMPEVLRSVRLVREYARELSSDEDNPQREASLRRRMELLGLLDKEEEAMGDDPVIHSRQRGG